MANKVVVLNSGGFDSIVLVNRVKYEHPDWEIHSLHFLYGARNEEQQLKCVNKVCEKVNAVNKVITLPKMTWTNSNFYKEGFDYKSQYIEYRNLIFISYALSYAESIGANRVYVAVLKGGAYNDTNSLFFKGLNTFSEENSGISIKTPFADLNKHDLISLALQSNMVNEDYFSCDVPNEKGEPCGECLDCKDLELVHKELAIDHPMKAFIQSGGNFKDLLFKELLADYPIYEVRALINNDCQLNCEHCFYGFDRMHGEQMSKEDYYEVLKEFVLKYHVKNIHFSGKEPLFDDSILWYAQKIHEELPCTFNLVTNGINLPKYAEDLKKFEVEHVALSVDDILETKGVRKVKGVTDKALKACQENGIKVEVFIDLHEGNYNRIPEIVGVLEDYDVYKYYFRTIRNLGNAEVNNITLLKGEQRNRAWEDVVELALELKDKEFDFNVSLEYLDTIKGTPLGTAIKSGESLRTMFFMDNLVVCAEEYCTRYSGTYTLTPDGYLLGCASEVSCSNYWETCVGNVVERPLEDLINKAEMEAYTCNNHMCDYMECTCKFLQRA